MNVLKVKKEILFIIMFIVINIFIEHTNAIVFCFRQLNTVYVSLWKIFQLIAVHKLFFVYIVNNNLLTVFTKRNYFK